jgi:uncharacterized membrane protein
MKAETEKCYGVAMKGKNDCKGGRRHQSCAGTSKTDLSGQCMVDGAQGHLREDHVEDLADRQRAN